MPKPLLTYAVCTYNRATLLKSLLPKMRSLACPVPYEVLVVDNNSSDDTAPIVRAEGQRSAEGLAPLRYVFESNQGITHARNRAIGEAHASEYLVFIDDDEWPDDDILAAAVNALRTEGAQCVGGRIAVALDRERPSWLTEELLGFLGETDHGKVAVWVTTKTQPLWSGNVGYRTSIFADRPELRFDARFNRAGDDVGGGEDAVMFWKMLELNLRIRYRPDMKVLHMVEPWRLRRAYFLRLHFEAGRKFGRFRTPDYPHSVLGVPMFMVRQALGQFARIPITLLFERDNSVRQGMNAMHAVGTLLGRLQRWKAGRTR